MRRLSETTGGSLLGTGIQLLLYGGALTACVVALVSVSNKSAADEAGVSLWLPGQFGSMAAVPSQPGWSFASILYHTNVKADGGQAFPRGGRIQAGLDAQADLVFSNVNYVFATPVMGAQAAIGFTVPIGRMRAAVDATLTGPRGNIISGSVTDTKTAIGDIYPMATLKWNQGVNNFMTYLSGDIPVGAYNANRIANIGIGHGGIDGGVGYTYFNPGSGHEFSVVSGLTYNFKNTDTDYQNGVNWHLDWGASQFLSQQLHIGIVGYFYQQITGDQGSGSMLGDFKSRVIGIGPQVGYIIPMGGVQGYLNLKGYKEFAAENRPEGYSVWLTFAVSPAAPAPAPPRSAMVMK